jgi:glycosyltransferase involved in cell wall biosynthesis
MDKTPLVSIRCMVYNHEPYLRQCLDGFVMQQTSFPFEAIVHDDASTDGSAAIILEYAERYPDIIKPIIETENQYSKEDGTIRRILDAAMHPDSKYIALCEGDDYWTDPQKLQIQVSFLEQHPDYSLAAHDFKVYEDANDRFRTTHPIDFLNDDEEYKTLTIHDYKKGLFFTQTLSCVYRKDALLNSKFYSYEAKFDMTLFYAILTQGKCVLFNRVMGVYRTHPGSATSGGNSRKFHDTTDFLMLKICEVEGTKESRDFVYNYLKPLALYEFLCKRWNVVRGYFRYLGLRRGVSLISIDPCLVALEILSRKIRNRLK